MQTKLIRSQSELYSEFARAARIAATRAEKRGDHAEATYCRNLAIQHERSAQLAKLGRVHA